ncbi:MAG: NUDIX hydrolase [candidate division WOR-3 bacterium]
MKVIEERVVYKGKFMDFVVLRYEKGGKVYDRQLVKHPGAVVIIPVMDDGGVIYEKQFRFAVGGYIYELPAGTLEPNEDPLETAKRELIEETGYEAGTWEKLAEFYLAPGYSTEYMYLYLARDLKFVGRKLDGDEDIEVVIWTKEDIERGIREGIIRDAKTLIGSMFYLNRL